MEFLLLIGALLLIAIGFFVAGKFSAPRSKWPDNDTIDRQGFANTVRNLTVNQVTTNGGGADMSWQKAVLPNHAPPGREGHQALQRFLGSDPVILIEDASPDAIADENTRLMKDILLRLDIEHRVVNADRDPNFFASIKERPCLFIWGKYFTDAKGLLDRIHDGSLSMALDEARISYDKKFLDALQAASRNA